MQYAEQSIGNNNDSSVTITERMFIIMFGGRCSSEPSEDQLETQYIRERSTLCRERRSFVFYFQIVINIRKLEFKTFSQQRAFETLSSGTDG